MFRRYQYLSTLAPVPPAGVLISGSTIINETFNTITEKTFITNGIAGATVTIKCTDIRGSDYPHSQFLYVYGPNVNMALNTTFTIVLDALGNADFNTICYAGVPPPIGGFTATLQIISMTGGVVGPYASKTYSRTN